MTEIDITRERDPILSLIEVCGQASHRSKIIYYRGDRIKSVRLAEAARNLYETGCVILVQRRMARSRGFEYIAIKTKAGR